VTGAQDFVLQTVRIGKIIVQLYKTLVMDALLNQHANQKQKMLMESTAHPHQLHMVAQSPVKLWMD
jgi:hypothetical protein